MGTAEYFTWVNFSNSLSLEEKGWEAKGGNKGINVNLGKEFPFSVGSLGSLAFVHSTF